MDLLLPALRADFKACETYRYSPGTPLHCPVTALGGIDDPHASAHAIEAWRAHTNGRFRWRLFPGGHFFHVGAHDTLVSELRSELQECRTAALSS